MGPPTPCTGTFGVLLGRRKESGCLGRSRIRILSPAGLPELQTLPGDSHPLSPLGISFGYPQSSYGFSERGGNLTEALERPFWKLVVSRPSVQLRTECFSEHTNADTQSTGHGRKPRTRLPLPGPSCAERDRPVREHVTRRGPHVPSSRKQILGPSSALPVACDAFVSAHMYACLPAASASRILALLTLNQSLFFSLSPSLAKINRD